MGVHQLHNICNQTDLCEAFCEFLLQRTDQSFTSWVQQQLNELVAKNVATLQERSFDHISSKHSLQVVFPELDEAAMRGEFSGYCIRCVLPWCEETKLKPRVKNRRRRSQ